MYEFLDYVVEDAMSRQTVTVTPDTTLADLEAIFEKHDFNGVPVLDAETRLIGWVTKLDLLSAFRFDDEHMFPPYADIMKRAVADIMARDVVTVTPRAKLTRVLEKLVDTRAKSFPVVDDDQVVGIVSREDVLAALRQAAKVTG
jgi:CBS domain-containing protein